MNGKALPMDSVEMRAIASYLRSLGAELVIDYTREDFVERGEVYDVTADELERADAYETGTYVRESRTLKSGTDAWVYIAR